MRSAFARSMNRLVRVALALCALAAGLLPGPGARGAPADQDEVISFARLNAPEYSLRGPFDAAYLDFSLPADWKLRDKATLELRMAVFASGEASAPTAATGKTGQTSDTGRGMGGSLQVMLNNITLETVLLERNGEMSVSIPISMTALLAPRSDGRHVLSMLLDTHEPCGMQQATIVIIRPSSALVLPHSQVDPPTDLALFPRPIYQRSFHPDAATVVVPDKPTAADLQAALTVAVGLGHLTDSKFKLDLARVGELTKRARGDAHLIFVGKAPDFPILAEARLPAPAKGPRFSAPGAAAGDGVVQMAVSPWNSSKVLLVVGGEDDSAVIKAAQAVASGTLRGGASDNVALIAATQPQASADGGSVDRTLAEMGYGVQAMYGLGGQYAGYRFDIPVGQTVSEDAYIDLVFVHTAALDYDQSGLTVSLNGEPVASVRLDDTTTRLGSTRVALPATAMRPGTNTLTVRADLLPRVVCVDPRGNGLWMSIRPESLLHLPLEPAQASQPARPIDLASYPAPFTTRPDFSGLALVLAHDDPVGWQVAAKLAFDMGRQSQGGLVNLAAAYGDALPDQVRQERDLLLVGRPSALPLLGELKGALPAPFEPGSDLASEPAAQVVYRMPEGTSIGYIQLLAAPWSAERTVMAVLGSTDEALQTTGAALITPQLRSQLSGNLAVIDGAKIESHDTRPKPKAEQPEQPEEGAEPAAEPAAERPSTMLLVAGAGGAFLALGGIVFGVFWWLRRRARKRAPEEPPGGAA